MTRYVNESTNIRRPRLKQILIGKQSLKFVLRYETCDQLFTYARARGKRVDCRDHVVTRVVGPSFSACTDWADIRGLLREIARQAISIHAENSQVGRFRSRLQLLLFSWRWNSYVISNYLRAQVTWNILKKRFAVIFFHRLILSWRLHSIQLTKGHSHL